MLVQVLNGLAYGGMLYILAVGLVLIWGLRRVINFAHGGLFMIGAYVGYSVAPIAGFWVGVLAAIVVLAAFGALLDVGVFRTLQRQDEIVTILVTFGILLVLQDLAQAIWGKDFLSMSTPPALSGTIKILGSDFPVYRLLVIAVAAVVAAALSLWLRRSRIGLFVRASAADPITTAVQGVNTDGVSIVVVGLGTALAGLSGAIAGPLFALSPTMGSNIVIDSFIVVVVGGIRSFSGAFAAAFLIGQIHNFGVVYLPWSATLIPILLMVAVLVWRPTGVGGNHA